MSRMPNTPAGRWAGTFLPRPAKRHRPRIQEVFSPQPDMVSRLASPDVRVDRAPIMIPVIDGMTGRLLKPMLVTATCRRSRTILASQVVFE